MNTPEQQQALEAIDELECQLQDAYWHARDVGLTKEQVTTYSCVDYTDMLDNVYDYEPEPETK